MTPLLKRALGFPKMQGSPWPFGEIQPFSAGTILIDPPWDFATYSEAGQEKSPSKHYDTMTVEQLAAMPVGHLASPDGCWMVMWVTGPTGGIAPLLMEHWGFEYRTEGSWAKQSTTGKKWAFGPGYIFRGCAEFYIVGKMGEASLNTQPGAKSVRNIIVAPAREHSRKPEQMHADIEARFPGPYVEIFGRQRRAGWQVFGNETDKFPPAGAAA